MKFPERWLDDDSEAAASMRDVLRQDREMVPPEGAQQAVWLALAAKIGAAGAGGAGAAGAGGKVAAGASAKAAAAAAGGAVGGGLLKSVAIGAICGLVTVGGYSALSPGEPGKPAAPANVAAAAVSVAPSASARSGDAPASAASGAASAAPAISAEGRGAAVVVSGAPRNGEAAVASGEPSASAPAASASGEAAAAPGSPEERASRLREENEMLAQARAALRGGDPAGAMRSLEQARQKFPDGVLGQEREALTIEALAKSGAREAASARAAAFIAAHPTSPHAARLQAFVLP